MLPDTHSLTLTSILITTKPQDVGIGTQGVDNLSRGNRHEQRHEGNWVLSSKSFLDSNLGIGAYRG